MGAASAGGGPVAAAACSCSGATAAAVVPPPACARHRRVRPMAPTHGEGCTERVSHHAVARHIDDLGGQPREGGLQQQCPAGGVGLAAGRERARWAVRTTPHGATPLWQAQQRLCSTMPLLQPHASAVAEAAPRSGGWPAAPRCRPQPTAPPPGGSARRDPAGCAQSPPAP